MASEIKEKLYQFLDKKLYHDTTPKDLSPRKTALKWFALFSCCMCTMGGYYCHDAASPLQTPIMEIFGISATKFNLIYTVYSLPNIVMPLLGGFIIDKLGVRTGLTLFASLIIFGQIIITIGVQNLSFGAMLFGTAIMGIGLDSLCAAKSTMIVKWFHEQELAFAMGLTLTVSRLGSSLSSYLSPWLYANSGSLTTPFGIGIALGIYSLIVIGFLCFIDSYADDKEHRINIHNEEHQPKDKFEISDMKNFKLIFYLIMLNCMIAYAVIKGFLNNASDLMNTRFGFNPQLSGKYLSIVFILATVFSPVFGGIADRIGKRVTLLLGSFILLAFVHLQVAFLTDTEAGNPNRTMLLPIIGVGIAFSAYAAIIWPAVSLVVEEKANGTAYGFALSMQNLMLSIIPLVVGFVHDTTMDVSHGYYWTEIFLLILSLGGVYVTLLIKKEDVKTGGVLEAPPNQVQRENNVGYVQFTDDRQDDIELYQIRAN